MAVIVASRTGKAAVNWGSLDDVVMGGVSESGLFFSPSTTSATADGGGGGEGGYGRDAAVFAGTVSTSNNGGFASVRSKNWAPRLDLGGYEGLRVTLKGDGQRYKLILRTSDAWDSMSYCASVDTPVRRLSGWHACSTRLARAYFDQHGSASACTTWQYMLLRQMQRISRRLQSCACSRSRKRQPLASLSSARQQVHAIMLCPGRSAPASCTCALSPSTQALNRAERRVDDH